MQRKYQVSYALLVCLIGLCVAGSLGAQTIGPGTYSLPTDGNFGDNESIGSNTTVNVNTGGEIGQSFLAGLDGQTNTDLVVNNVDGYIGHFMSVHQGSVFNATGGETEAMTVLGGEANISGGLLRGASTVSENGIATITGGTLNGYVGNSIQAFSNGQVNIHGGYVYRAGANSNGFVNVAGGTLDRIEAGANGTVNVSGGSFNYLRVRSSGTAGVTSGNARFYHWAESGSSLRLMGGVTGGLRSEFSGTTEIVGGEFRLNGSTVSGVVSLSDKDVLTGTLEDGSVFVFSTQSGDRLNGVQLTTVGLLGISSDPYLISDSNAPAGLRPGESLNLLNGGVLDRNFSAVSAAINMTGGTFGNNLKLSDSALEVTSGFGGSVRLFDGSSLNLSGDGSVGAINAYVGTSVTISGGQAGSISAREGVNLSVSGGTVGQVNTLNETTSNPTTAEFSGGSFTGQFIVGDAVLRGGEFRLNGQSITEMPAVVPEDSILTGTFADGSPFIFSSLVSDRDFFSNVSLDIASDLPSADTSLIVVDEVNTTLTGLRQGQSMELRSNGTLVDGFRATGASIQVSGGSMAEGEFSYGEGVRISDSSLILDSGYISRLRAYNESSVDINGGLVDDIHVYSGSSIKIADGAIGDLFVNDGGIVSLEGGGVDEYSFFYAGSELRVFATEFYVDGVELDLDIGNSMRFDSRNVDLSGLLADGSSFLFNLTPNGGSDLFDVFSEDAIVTLFRVSAVPEPSAALVLLGLGTVFAIRRRRSDSAD